MTARPMSLLVVCSVLAAPVAALAQPLGTFRWQLSPFCNVVTLAATQNGAIYRLEGFDDQCGAAQRAIVTGMAVPNTDGTLELGLTIVAAGAAPSHVDVTFDVSSLGGVWRDSGGQGGTFLFNPGPAGGTPRPQGLGRAAVDSSQIQQRINGTCAAGTFVQSIAQNGAVACGADGAGNGD